MLQLDHVEQLLSNKTEIADGNIYTLQSVRFAGYVLCPFIERIARYLKQVEIRR